MLPVELLWRPGVLPALRGNSREKGFPLTREEGKPELSNEEGPTEDAI